MQRSTHINQPVYCSMEGQHTDENWEADPSLYQQSFSAESGIAHSSSWTTSQRHEPLKYEPLSLWNESSFQLHCALMFYHTNAFGSSHWMRAGNIYQLCMRFFWGFSRDWYHWFVVQGNRSASECLSSSTNEFIPELYLTRALLAASLSDIRSSFFLSFLLSILVLPC